MILRKRISYVYSLWVRLKLVQHKRQENYFKDFSKNERSFISFGMTQMKNVRKSVKHQTWCPLQKP